MSDKLFVPAAFVSLLADMPAPTARPDVRGRWLVRQLGTLRAAFPSADGMVAMRLGSVVRQELDELAAGGAS